MVTLARPDTRQMSIRLSECRSCKRTMPIEDVSDECCILCKVKQRRCYYCSDVQHEDKMYHIPSTVSQKLHRWICFDCFNSPQPKTPVQRTKPKQSKVMS